jgi:acyl-CoA synthetase (AMP-forming)/AMP-acid ligase II
MRKRLTVCVTIHAGYLLLALIVVAAENPRLLREIPVFLAGPLSLVGYLGSWHPWVSELGGQVLIIAFLTGCFVLLMSAHPFRPNLIGVTLTSLNHGRRL